MTDQNTESKLSVVVGTKGMLIKTAGISRELDRRGINYRYINLGQHGQRMSQLNDMFKLKQFDVNLSKEEDKGSIKEVMKWFFQTLISHRNIVSKKSLLVIQGDTPATLLGFMLGKLQRSKIAHVEAGLRSYNFLNPFPEELIRRIIDEKSDILFVPSKTAYHNLINEINNGEIIDTKYNTVLDSIRIALKTKKNVPSYDYVLASIHRVENIYSEKRMNVIFKTINKIGHNILWPLHMPTKNYIVRKLKQKLSENVKFMPLQDYFSFIHLMNNSLYIITDGGGPQEESFILGTPCLLMRERTERHDGLGKNVLLSEFKENKINYFLNNFEKFKNELTINEVSPSKIIVDELERIM